MRMDREWMYNSRFLEGRKDYNPAFIDRVVSFMEFACQQRTIDRDNDLIRCPCSSCKNRAYKSIDDIMLHVVTKGFVKNYYQWTSHGEPEVGSSSMQPNCNTSSNKDNEGPNPYRNMILEAAGHDFNPNSHENVSQPQPSDPKTKRLYELLHQADEPLWPGCTKVSQLLHVSRMINIKSESRMTEKIYDDVMQVLEDKLPPDSKLVGSFYETKKFASDLGLPCEKIDSYGMLSGWSTTGKKACPYCMENSKAFSLFNGGKVSWFDCHRQFLPKDHPFRRNKNDFIKNRSKLSQSPLTLIGEQVIEQIDEFELKETNLIRHNLDVMHIEKNVFENVSETVMDIEGKTKDNAKARDDVKIYCKRKELEKNELTEKYLKSCYTLGKDEKKVICDWVSKIKFPDGYVSNMARCVDMKKYKMFGMKSHDCHVFMQRLIPIAFRELLPITVWKALTELSLFFKNLTCTTIEVDDMIGLHTEIPVILCKLEKIFPPGFFDLMEHLPVHFPFLGKLKKKVTNKAKVESSIANAYLIEETSMFCSHYFEPHVKTKMNRLPRNDDGVDEELYEGTISIFKCSGRVCGQAKKRRLDDQEYDAARTYVLLNCDEIEQYVKIFIEEIKKIEPNLTDVQVDTRLERKFANWFNDYARDSGNVDSQIIKDVASGPLRSVVTYLVYFVNGYKFYTSKHGLGRSTYNSGVSLKGSNYSDESNDYYGILAEIVQLEYPALPIKRVVLFRCDWFDPTPNIGMKVHKGLRWDKVDWWALSKAKPRSFIDLLGDNMAFQDDEVNMHLLDDVNPNDSDDASLGDDTD
nr:hypothetical protein [Tanacetum cinerariifolium]